MQLSVAIISFDTEGEPTGLRFKFPQRNSTACFMHLDDELMILMDLQCLPKVVGTPVQF